MKNKKSFVLYSDLIHTTEHLSNEDAGKVFKWVLEYVNDKNPKPLKGLLAAVCEPIKQQLKRDLLKYESKRVQYSEAGKKSAEARRVKKLEESKDNKGNQQTLTNVKVRSTKSTVSDSVSVTVNDSVINKDKEKALSYWLDYRKEIKKPIKAKKTLNSLIKKFNKTDLDRVREVLMYSVNGSYQGLFWDDAPKTVKTTKNMTDEERAEQRIKEIKDFQ